MLLIEFVWFVICLLSMDFYCVSDKGRIFDTRRSQDRGILGSTRLLKLDSWRYLAQRWDYCHKLNIVSKYGYSSFRFYEVHIQQAKCLHYKSFIIQVCISLERNLV